MKKIFFHLASLCLFGALAHAQTSITPDWTHQVDITNSDYATDIWVDSAGATYAFGRITNYGGQLDALVITKTDNQGQEVWRRFLYAVDQNWQLFAQAVVGDAQGNLYFLYNEKTRYTDSNRNRIGVCQYSPEGDLIWNQYLTESIENRTEEAQRRVFKYHNGALYILGSMYDENLWTTQGSDGILYKVNAADGSIVWRKVYDSIYHSDDMLKDLAISDSGDIWAIGRSRGYAFTGGVYSNYDSVTLKWDAQGNFQGERRLNGSGNAEDFGINLTLDAAGNCYTSSQVKRLGINAMQVVIEKISGNGSVLWSKASVSSSTGYTTKQPIEVLPNGQVVFATSNADGINLIALHPDTGTELWTTQFNRNNLGAQNRQSDMTIDDQGNIYLTGSSRDNTPFGNGIDMTTLKYNANGQLLWYSYLTVGNYATAGDFGDVLRWNQDQQSLYVVGSVQDASNNNNYLIAKYGATGLGVSHAESSLLRLYPNPTQGWLYWRSEVAEKMVYELYDSNARLVKEGVLDPATETASAISLAHLPAGIYIFKGYTQGAQQTCKIIKQN